MARLTHAGAGLAAKGLAPRVPLWALLLGAYALDLIWGLFYLAKVARLPSARLPSAKEAPIYALTVGKSR